MSVRNKPAAVWYVFLFSALAAGLVYSQTSLAVAKDNILKQYREFEQKGDFDGFLKTLNKIPDLPLFKKNYFSALSLYGKLNLWQERKNWPKFFGHRSEYKRKIEKLLSGSGLWPLPYSLKAKFLQWELLYLLKDKDKDSARKDFLKAVKGIKTADLQTAKILKDMIAALSKIEDRSARLVLSKKYVDLLSKTNDFDFIVRQAGNFAQNGDFDSAYVLYKRALSLALNLQQKQAVLDKAVSSFGCFGFGGYCEPYYADEFLKLYSDIGIIPISRDVLYLRGYNWEQGYEYKKAAGFYEEFLSKYPQSKLKDEVVFRLGYIYMYHLLDFDKAREYFSRLEKSRYPQLRMSASSQISYVSYRDFSNLGYNQKTYLENLFAKNNTLLGKLNIKAQTRNFAGRPVVMKVSLAGLGTGCLMPDVLYLWSGDLGDINISTNSPQIKSSFSSPGLKIVQVLGLIASKPEGMDSLLINIHKAVVTAAGKEFPAQAEVLFDIDIYPPLPESMLSFSWQIEGPEKINYRGKTFVYYFDQPGKYSGRLSVNFLQKKILEKTFSFRIVSK